MKASPSGRRSASAQTICETKKYDYWCKLAVERTDKLEMTDERFERKTNLDVVHTLTDPFGIIQCEQFRIEVLLDRMNAQMLMDRDWPKDRVTFSEPDKDGNVIFSCISHFRRIRGPALAQIHGKWG